MAALFCLVKWSTHATEEDQAIFPWHASGEANTDLTKWHCDLKSSDKLYKLYICCVYITYIYIYVYIYIYIHTFLTHILSFHLYQCTHTCIYMYIQICIYTHRALQMHLSFTVFALIQFHIPTEDGCFSHNFLDVSLDLPSRAGEVDVRVKGPCKMQPGHYFFIDGRDEEWPEVWWCDQICHIHEKVWGRNPFFSIHKSEQRFILGLLRTLQPLLWTYAFLPMFVQGSCFSSWLSLCLSFFLHKKNMAEVHPYQKRWTCFENFGTWKNMGVFFSQLFWSPKLFFWLFSWVVRDLWCQSASGQRDQVMIERFIGKCNQKMEDHVRLGLDFMSE